MRICHLLLLLVNLLISLHIWLVVLLHHHHFLLLLLLASILLVTLILAIFFLLFCKLVLRVLQHLLLEIGRRHRLRLLVDELVVRLELLGEGALDDAAHAFELAAQRLQFGTAGRDRLL